MQMWKCKYCFAANDPKDQKCKHCGEHRQINGNEPDFKNYNK